MFGSLENRVRMGEDTEGDKDYNCLQYQVRQQLSTFPCEKSLPTPFLSSHNPSFLPLSTFKLPNFATFLNEDQSILMSYLLLLEHKLLLEDKGLNSTYLQVLRSTKTQSLYTVFWKASASMSELLENSIFLSVLNGFDFKIQMYKKINTSSSPSGFSSALQ